MKDLAHRFARRPNLIPEQSHDVLIIREAVRFRQLAVLAWDEKTVYPKSQYIAGSSKGQCGVTNFGFGVWLANRKLVDPEGLSFEEGIIVAADGSLLVGDDHTWLHVDLGIVAELNYTHTNLGMRFDLAGDQFPGIDAPISVQYHDFFYPDAQTSCLYAPNRVTPFWRYDRSRFGERLGHFMLNVCNAAEPNELPASLSYRF